MQGGGVVSGIRTVEEISFYRRAFQHAIVVDVRASERTRYERFLWRKRSRGDSRMSLEEFRRLDQEQSVFGLLPVARHVADLVVVNEGALAEYRARSEAVADGVVPRGVVDLRVRQARNVSQSRDALAMALRTLGDSGGAMLVDSLVRDVAERCSDRVARRAARLLRLVPGLVAMEGEGIRLLSGGRAYLDILDRSMPRSFDDAATAGH